MAHHNHSLTRALGRLWSDLAHHLSPRPPRSAVPLSDLNRACGMLLRGCRSADPAKRARCATALGHMSAARNLARLGYSAHVVNAVAGRGLAAAQGR